MAKFCKVSNTACYSRTCAISGCINEILGGTPVTRPLTASRTCPDDDKICTKPACSKDCAEVDTSVAVKADENKNRVELLPVGPMLAISEVLTFGAKKYADHNWRKGFKWSRLLGAAMRHLFAFASGENKDPETGLSHLAHLGCCVLFLLEHEQRKLGEDDRFKS